jgi:hypothetical protein
MLPEWKAHVAKRVSDENIGAFSMHFLFVPFPSADEFRKLFRDQLGLNAEKKDEAPETTGLRPVPAAASTATAATPSASRRSQASSQRRQPPAGKGRSRGSS